MSPEAQRIAIAEACGFIKEDISLDGRTCFWKPKGAPVWIYFSELPDYLNDLNAMHEVEMHLFKNYHTVEGSGVLSLYTKYLCRIEHPLFATAAQRAEAFLKTIGKWNEDA